MNSPVTPISALADAAMEALGILGIRVEPELLPDVLTLLAAMAEGSNDLGQVLAELRRAS